jgi:hypothetical protein
MSRKAVKQTEEIKALKERVRWAIGYICDNFKMTNEKIGKEMGCATSTINSYRSKITVPGMDFSAYLKKYNFSSDWLNSGTGEPFPGAREKYPEVCGPADYIGVRDNTDQYGTLVPDTLFKSDQKINIEEAMGKTYKVLNAGTALSVALYMNIQQFAAALDTGQALQVCQDQMKVMQEQIDDLNLKMDRLTAPSIPGRQADGSEKEAM